MASRGRTPLHYDGRAAQAPGMLRQGPFSGLPAGHRLLEPHPPPELLENKIAVQAAEIERLAGDNHRLAASHITMREDLAAAQQEIPRLKAHIRSIHTESDIQIRFILDKIARMESDIKAGERLKKDLQQAHIEAQSLARARQGLTSKIQQASEELHKTQLQFDLHAELDSLRQECQMLLTTFEYEKGVNIENVEQLQSMENNLIGMAREMEKLRAEVMNAEMGANAPNPYGGTYMNPNPSYPPSVQAGGSYVDDYGQPLVQMGVVQTGDGMIPYGSGNGVAAACGVGGAAVPASTVGAAWGVLNDPSIARRCIQRC